MRSIKLLPVLFLFCLTSCTFTENMYINDDGSGKFSIEMDASQLMAMVPKDSLNPERSEKDIDSTFTFKELFEEKKDSISKLPLAEQEKLRKLENFSMSIQMKNAEKKFNFSMVTDFKNVSELEDAMTTMDEVKNLSKQNAIPASDLAPKNAALKYTYSNKKFTRKTMVDKKKVKKVENDSADAYKVIYESSTYVMKYHFPKRVKKVSNKTALFSEDRRTITIEYPFNEYLENPEKLNFEVEFE